MSGGSPAAPHELDSPADARFRAEAVAWLDAHAGPHRLPDGVDMKHPAFDARARAWQRVRNEHGWGSITWPTEHGGRGGTAREEGIFLQEAAARQLPMLDLWVGMGMCAPTLLVHGTDAQKQRFLPPMLNGDEMWCQLFSEPGAGSDLAGLSTRATRDGDEFVVNGQKVWTSGAHDADWAILLARTDFDVPKHKGITFFLLDMRSPGVEVRPLRQMTGEAHFNEVFLTDVRVPAANVVGEVDRGWAAVHTMLGHERAAMGRSDFGVRFDELTDLVARMGASSDPVLRQQLAELYSRQQILRYLNLRVMAATARGLAPGAEASVQKLAVSDYLVRLGSLVVHVQRAGGMLVGNDAVDDGAWQRSFLQFVGSRIAGGTEQIQRNTVGERVLGLPAEPRIDKEIPFSRANPL